MANLRSWHSNLQRLY